jgi:Ca2+/Na+ antiporter
MLPIIRQEITIRKSPLYFLMAIFLIFLFIINETKKIYTVTMLLLAGVLLLFLLTYYMLSKNKLIIDNDGISQQLFIAKTKELKWAELKSAGFVWDYHGHSANLTLEFIEYSGKKISLQSSFYSRKKLQFIAESLLEKASRASIDKKLKGIAEGKFPWYIF